MLALLCLLSLFFAQSYGFTETKDLDKKWVGNAVGTVQDIQIKLDNGTVVFSGQLPPSHEILIKGIWSGQTATITWSDINGEHSEVVGPITSGDMQSFCDDGAGNRKFVVINTIYHPVTSVNRNIIGELK